MVNAILSKASYAVTTEQTNPLPADSALADAGLEAAVITVKESTFPAPAAVQQEPVSRKKDIEQAVATLNKHVQLSQRGIVFAEDKDTGIDVIKVIDSKTNKVLLQFPSEDLIEVAKRLDDMRGVFFQKSA